MRSWFPLTDYDFYGYLVSGSVLLFACDFAFNGGAIALHPEWTFVQVVLVIALAYVTGHFIAWPSSLLLEHVLMHRILRSPFSIQVGAAKPRLAEHLVGALLTGRDYEPLGEDARTTMCVRAAAISGQDSSYYADSPRRLYQPAYEFAKSVPQTMARMEQFRNLYGLMRNLAFTSFVSAAIFGWQTWVTGESEFQAWTAVALLGGLGMLLRHLKFYGAFASEITRCFAYSKQSGG